MRRRWRASARRSRCHRSSKSTPMRPAARRAHVRAWPSLRTSRPSGSMGRASGSSGSPARRGRRRTFGLRCGIRDAVDDDGEDFPGAACPPVVVDFGVDPFRLRRAGRADDDQAFGVLDGAAHDLANVGGGGHVFLVAEEAAQALVGLGDGNDAVGNAIRLKPGVDAFAPRLVLLRIADEGAILPGRPDQLSPPKPKLRWRTLHDATELESERGAVARRRAFWPKPRGLGDRAAA